MLSLGTMSIAFLLTALAAAPLAASAQGPRVVDVYSVDYAFIAPDTIAAGATTFHLVNRGPSDHIIVLFALPAGMSLATFDHLMRTDSTDGSGTDGTGIVKVGGPEGPPAGSTESWATIELAPGRYVLTCLLALPDGSTHRMHGMFRQLTVLPASGQKTTMPHADAVVHMTDFAFDGPDSLAPGRHMVRFENAGQRPHMAIILRLAPGKTLADVAAWMTHPEGPAPYSAAGGTTDMAAGRASVVSLDLEAGHYLIACAATEGTAPQAHYQAGMVREFVVR